MTMDLFDMSLDSFQKCLEDPAELDKRSKYLAELERQDEEIKMDFSRRVQQMVTEDRSLLSLDFGQPIEEDTGFGLVINAKDNGSGTKIVLKTLSPEVDDNFIDLTTSKLKIVREHALLSVLRDNPNVVNTYGFVSNNQVPYVILEYLPNTIEDAVNSFRLNNGKKGRPKDSVRDVRPVLELARDLGTALKQMDEEQIINLDIKMRNIRTKGANRIDAHHVHKLIDYSDSYQLARRMPERIFCTEGYGAPEVVSRKLWFPQLSPAVDWYSAGLVLAATAFMALGYDYDSEASYLIGNRKSEEHLIDQLGMAGVRTRLIGMIEGLIQIDPGKRTSPESLLDQVTELEDEFGTHIVNKQYRAADLSRHQSRRISTLYLLK